MEANRPTHTSTKVQFTDGTWVEIDPNTKEGFNFLREHHVKSKEEAGAYINYDWMLALIHCLDLPTKYGQRTAAFLVRNVLNEVALNAPAFINKIDPNTHRGQQLVKAITDRHKTPDSHAELKLSSVRTLLEKIDPSNIHGSKSVRHLASAGLISDDLELEAVKRPKGVEVDLASPDRGDVIEFLTSQRLGMNIPRSLNGNLDSACATFAADRRKTLGRVPINTISRR